MSLVELLVLSLAGWRITSLVSREDGPWYILGKIRGFLGVRYDEYSQPYGLNVISRGLVCMWCSSVWVGVGLTVLYLIAPDIVIFFCLPFALSSVVIAIEKVVLQHGES
jgi:hypothetical protein